MQEFTPLFFTGIFKKNKFEQWDDLCLCSEVESPFDFPNICESTNLHNLAMKSEIAVHPHRDNDEARGVLENSFFMLSCNKKKTANVPTEVVDEVNATVHILTTCCVLGPSEKKESIFSAADFEFRELVHAEGRVKRLNLSIDLQMLLTALSLISQWGDALWQKKKVCSYCHRFPLNMSVGKLEQVRY